MADFTALPFRDRSVDKILAVNVAYFWDEPMQVLHEARRVLRPGGAISIYVTDAASMRRWRFAGPDTHRLYDAAALSEVLCRGGFVNAAVTVVRLTSRPGISGLILRAASPG